MTIDNKLDTDIVIRILNIVSLDVREHIAPYLRRNKVRTPIIGDARLVREGLYEVPLFYVVQGTRHIVERYLLNGELDILYPSPRNESAKVIAAKVAGVPETHDGT